MIAPGDRKTFTTNLVWDTPAAELLRVKDQKLREMGLSESAMQTMIGNPWHSLSLLTALVTVLDQLQGVSGRDTVATLAASAISEDDARFVTAATQMLVSYLQTVALLSAIMSRGTVPARDQRGAVVPAPRLCRLDRARQSLPSVLTSKYRSVTCGSRDKCPPARAMS